ncbi:MAG: hypothetical protein KatS3mg122_1186 [Caldimonas sp.]|uniref:TonB-dependent receptor plug domain-containing protein n=1 Tax=Caldimonas taiwanensis TaxID=307483 RepID=UPI000780B60F|nr:TonB-dependent receptor [Caldimonas taiwanensis]GIX23955.1 MAG: hypothetical protein KatS3mg122_1186 [Caldimonas sp.]
MRTCPDLRTPIAAAFLATLGSVQAQSLEEIVVIGTRAETQARIAAPNPVVVVGRDEIDKTNDLTLGDFLRRLPGMSFSGPAGNIKDIRLRGMDKGYTQILVDGEPWLSSTKERQVQVDQLPMSMVDRIEIHRSPLPDLPSDGIAGTINVVLRRVEGSEVNIKVGAGHTFGRQDQEPQGTVQINAARSWENGLAVVLPLNLNRRHELKTKPKIVETFDATTGTRTGLSEEYEIENNRVHEFTLGPRLVYRPDESDTFTLSAFYNLNDGAKHKTVDKYSFSDPAAGTGFVRDSSANEEEDKDLTTKRLSGQWQRRVSDSLSTQLGWVWQAAEEDKVKFKDNFDGGGTRTGTETEDARVRARSRKLHMSTRYAGWEDHTLALGLEWQRDARVDDKLKNGASQVSDSWDIDETRQVLFLRDDWAFAPGHVVAGGFRAERREAASVDQDGVRRDGQSFALNPSVAWRWSFRPHWRLRLGAAQTLKPPKFDQLSSVITSGDGSLSSPYVVGNPDLKPERSRGLDLGLETDFQGGNGFAALNVGERRIRNMIAKETRLEDDGFFYNRYYNVDGTSIVRTIELDGRFDLRALGLRHVALMVNYTRFFSHKAGSSEPLSDQPHYVVNTGMDWRVPAWRTLFGWRYNYQGKIFKKNTDTESPLHLLDVFAYWDIDRTWSLRVSGTNLLDARKTKLKQTYNGAGQLTARTREQEAGGRSLLVTLEARL